VFANVVLADEVNRASPRTQSALLEVMEERQVTVDGRPHRVPRPFLVMATQNPVEMDGTYPLPEAQLDRFLVKTTVGYPDHDAEVRVLAAEHAGSGVPDVAHVSSADEVARLAAVARRVHVSPLISDYIVRLVSHTRTQPQLRLGASPRGAIGLQRASRVRAALSGRHYVVPGDVQALAGPVLAHRVIPSPSYEASGGSTLDVIREAVEATPAPPTDQRR
jgi:MoxR-like ATPase